MRGLHLLQRHALFDHGLDAIPHNGDHVAILQQVKLIAQPAMPRNNERSALFMMCGNSDIENMIQPVDFSLQTAPVLEIDNRVAIGDEYVARADYVGTPKESE